MREWVVAAISAGILLGFLLAGATLAFWAFGCTQNALAFRATMRVALSILGVTMVGLFLLLKKRDDYPGGRSC